MLRRLLSSSAPRRASALENPSIGPFRVFDRHVKQMQKDRAATLEDGARSRTVDYVRTEIAERMAERLAVRNYPSEDIFTRFKLVGSIGYQAGNACHSGSWFWFGPFFSAARKWLGRPTSTYHDGPQWYVTSVHLLYTADAPALEKMLRRDHDSEFEGMP